MSLQITSLSTRYRVTPQGNLWEQDVPFIAVNATLKIEDDEHLFERTKTECQEYLETLTIDDPKKYEEFLLNWDFNYSSKYDGWGRAWIHNESPFVYIDKFSTFWFRDYVADSTVTRAIIAELEHYKEHGTLPSVYRHAEEYIIISHFHALDRYWD
jgi:hypothetical protein